MAPVDRVHDGLGGGLCGPFVLGDVALVDREPLLLRRVEREADLVHALGDELLGFDLGAALHFREGRRGRDVQRALQRIDRPVAHPLAIVEEERSYLREGRERSVVGRVTLALPNPVMKVIPDPAWDAASRARWSTAAATSASVGSARFTGSSWV